MKHLTAEQKNFRILGASGQVEHYKFSVINWQRVFDCLVSAFVGFVLAFLLVAII